MANFFYKDCDDCAERIRMAKMNNGQWLAFEAHRDGKHMCNINVAKSIALTSATPLQAKPKRPPLPPGLQPRTYDNSNELSGWLTLFFVLAFAAWLAGQIFGRWQ